MPRKGKKVRSKFFRVVFRVVFVLLFFVLLFFVFSCCVSCCFASNGTNSLRSHCPVNNSHALVCLSHQSNECQSVDSTYEGWN